MKLESFNINGLRSRLHQLEAVIEKYQPEIIAYAAMLSYFCAANINYDTRGTEKLSDHCPLCVELDLG